MAFVIADRVREDSVSTGTGNFTLGGAIAGYQAFSSVLSSGDTTYYTIAEEIGSAWEVGIGTFTSPSTLARTTVLSSSNAGNLVNFGSGDKDVFISLPASRTVQSFSGGTTGLTPASASYGAVSLGGTLAAINGGTGLSSYAVGDLLYASSTTELTKLADVATGNALISGGVNTAPAWGKITLTTHVSGILPAANGGTENGFTAFTGPTTSTKTFTLPNASSTILTTNAAVTIAQGGTNATTAATARTNLGLGTAATMTGPTGAIVGTTDTQTLTAKTIEAATFTNGYTEEVATANTATAYTIDLTLGSVQDLTLTGNCTFTFPTATAGRSFLLILRQDATGNRTATWPAAVRWPSSTAPTIIATASRSDLYGFTATGSVWLARTISQNYSA